MGKKTSEEPYSGRLAERLRGLARRLGTYRFPADAIHMADAAAGQIEDFLSQPMPCGQTAPEASAPGTFEESSHAAIRIWCDGSCAPNPGPGGWGAIVEREGRRIELSGAHPDCTNNIMEMTAAIRALEQTPEDAEIHITTDSRYVMDGITKWIAGWKRKGWRKSDKKPVLNQGLWMELDALNGKREVTWNWVRGHSGHPENERCDELANRARLER